MKQSNVLLIATSLLGMSISSAQATLTWDTYSLSYNVKSNAIDAMTAGDGIQVDRPISIAGPTDKKSKSFRDATGPAMNAVAKSSVTGSVGGASITMKTGATGKNTERGASVSAWQSIKTSEGNGLPSPIGIESLGKSQDLTAWNSRVFFLDEAGDYRLTGSVLTGGIGLQDLAYEGTNGFAPENLVDYEWSAKVRLDAISINADDSFNGSIGNGTLATLILDLSKPFGDSLTELMHLDALTSDGLRIRYSLHSQIDLSTEIFTKDSFYGDYYGSIPEGTFGAMGTEANPLTVEASLKLSSRPSEVPVPGAVVFFVSGMLGLFGVSRRRT